MLSVEWFRQLLSWPIVLCKSHFVEQNRTEQNRTELNKTAGRGLQTLSSPAAWPLQGNQKLKRITEGIFQISLEHKQPLGINHLNPSMFHSLTTLTVDKFFLMTSPSLPRCSFVTFLCVLSLVAREQGAGSSASCREKWGHFLMTSLGLKEE